MFQFPSQPKISFGVNHRALTAFTAGALVFFAGGVHAQDPAEEGRWIEPPGAAPFDNGFFTPGNYGWEPWAGRVENAVLLSSRDVLVWRNDNEQWLWDRQTGDFTNVTHPEHAGHVVDNCSGHAALPDGSTLVAGGGPLSNPTDAVHIWSRSAGDWVAADSLPEVRYYPTLTPLPDGTMLATGGQVQQDPTVIAGPAIYDPDTDSWTSTGIGPGPSRTYPFMHLIPSGQLSFTGPQFNTHLLDLDSELWINVPSNLLGWTGQGRAAATFGPGKVITAGGRESEWDLDEGACSPQQQFWPDVLYRESSNRAALIDFDIPNPANAVWDDDPDHYMIFRRQRFELVTLANGFVMAVGGQYQLNQCCEEDSEENCIWEPLVRDLVLDAEWINPYAPPVLREWSKLAASARPRANHSVALLLPDATVLAAGGKSFDQFPEEPTAEIFEPPYLFIENSGGQYAARPVIGQVPRDVNYDTDFKVTLAEGDVSAEDIAMVTLVRPGAITHDFDQDARFMFLDFNIDVPNNGLVIDAPVNANLAPPGRYMLFVISEPGVNPYGVPSEARFIRLKD